MKLDELLAMALVRNNNRYRATLVDRVFELYDIIEHRSLRLRNIERAIILAFNEQEENHYQAEKREVLYDLIEGRSRFFASARLYADVWPERVCDCLVAMVGRCKKEQDEHQWENKDKGWMCVKQAKAAEESVIRPFKEVEGAKRLLTCVGLAGLDQYVIQHISEFVRTPGKDYMYTRDSYPLHKTFYQEGKWYRNFPGKKGRRKNYLKWDYLTPALLSSQHF